MYCLPLKTMTLTLAGQGRLLKFLTLYTTLTFGLHLAMSFIVVVSGPVPFKLSTSRFTSALQHFTWRLFHATSQGVVSTAGPQYVWPSRSIGRSGSQLSTMRHPSPDISGTRSKRLFRVQKSDIFAFSVMKPSRFTSTVPPALQILWLIFSSYEPERSVPVESASSGALWKSAADTTSNPRGVKSDVAGDSGSRVSVASLMPTFVVASCTEPEIMSVHSWHDSTLSEKVASFMHSMVNSVAPVWVPSSV
mmetsp:Transcript_63656/g.138648  ORF Transcript_63656/g.138648 Transcript_63656/m.138648 type:complete len:249 (-) Transcript_63656:4091-4837(-)